MRVRPRPVADGRNRLWQEFAWKYGSTKDESGPVNRRFHEFPMNTNCKLMQIMAKHLFVVAY